MLLTILNIIVVAIFVTGYTPQFYTTIKSRQTEGVSVDFWYFLAVSTSITLHNILVSGNAEWYIYLGQFINAAVAFGFLLYFSSLIYYNESKLQFYAYTLCYLVCMVLILRATSLESSQLISTICIITAYIFQIRHFVRRKTSNGTNPLLFLLFALGLGFLTTILVLTEASIFVIVTELINILLLLTCFVLALKYSKGK